ncbi:UDP-glucuronic acid dehydrogenase [Vibrio breoganii]|uniref:UDP-glucuronic acid dehydrogenase n=1 Tax=Vibrio breoganii TaxID=553239 RepID=UPI000C851A39|nr:UDP-glucuronic acid dehydrogenase [Vibrio breoganii]PMM19794.1 UDP-glucuronic acid dehydrogenase [Vibrio breoganii]
MKITLLCSDTQHPIYAYLLRWVESQCSAHQIDLITRVKEIEQPGDILFLISCSEIVRKSTRDLFRYTLVLHASDLPEGRGWSPHIWDVVNGKDRLTLSLLDAEDSVDTGNIWQKRNIELDGTELYDEINHKLFQAELELLDWAVSNIDNSQSQPQENNDQSTYHRKRTPEDSKLDAKASIVGQFNLLRVCDPNRFPAYVVINNQRYNIRLEKEND